MSIRIVARNRGLQSSIKLLPIAYNLISRQIFTNPSLQNSRFGSLNSTTKKLFSLLSLPVKIQMNGLTLIIGITYHNSYYRRIAVNTLINFVPQQEAYVIERFGKFTDVLAPGLHFLVLFVDKVAYVHCLKEQTVKIPEQPAVTTDNVSIKVNGVLFATIVDPVKASYCTDNAMIAVTQLAQTVMRSCIGKMPLDKTFMERETLNANIVAGINAIAEQWGLSCRRYEIRDIIPPIGIRESMEKQAEAERNRRARVIQAEGEKEAKIQRAEGSKQDVVIASQAAKEDVINRATGYAEALRLRSKADAEANSLINEVLNKEGGEKAANLQVARAYVEAFSELAKKSTTVMLPSSVDNPSSLITQALTIYKKLNTTDEAVMKPKELE